MDLLSFIRTRRKPGEPTPEPNNAGGLSFALSAEQQLRRFLLLGTDGPTYYASAVALTRENAAVVVGFAERDGRRLTDVLLEISEAGRAPRQNPTLFAYACAVSLAADDDRAYALQQFNRIVRTGTHLLIFCRYVEQFRGWGRGLRRAVAGWHAGRDADALAYQLIKYRQREGWSQRDVLRLAHPGTTDPQVRGLYDWTCGREPEQAPRLLAAFRAAESGGRAEWLAGVTAGLSWEMLPDAALSEADVWRALLDAGLPMTALLRQLPRLTRLGLAHERREAIAAQLTDPRRLRAARVHPVNVLVALRTYASGRSARGEAAWTPERAIIDALDEAFYASFGTLEPSGSRILLALDISGSMASPISNLPLSCREAAAAIAMATARVERAYDVVGFTAVGGAWRNGTELTELSISPRQRLDDVIATTKSLPFGGTDCALPMLWAGEQGRAYDVFVVLTDNETWAGKIQPHDALTAYRAATGIPAKLVVVGMTATRFTIADPADAGSLDVVGFDAAVPQLISDFARGSLG